MSASTDARRLTTATQWLDRAAFLALRGHGGAEPNPMVGCIIVRKDGEVVGRGYHARDGQLHAEPIALKVAGKSAQGATAFVTLEPCSHHGRTPPCCDAIIAYGISRLVYAVADPNPLAAGGADRLRAAGIVVEQIENTACTNVSAPFLARIRSARPWVIAKWAQTSDGRTATRDQENRWISGPRSRAMVHRERARVDAVMIGIGTLLADDPHLLPRISRARRIPCRIIVDPQLATPIDAQIIRTARDGPVSIAALPTAIQELSDERRSEFANAGVTLLPLPTPASANVHQCFRGLLRGSLAGFLRVLHSRQVSTVLVEGGAGLLGALFEEDLIDDAWCFTGPLASGDDSSTQISREKDQIQPMDPLRFRLLDRRLRGEDTMTLWRRTTHC